MPEKNIVGKLPPQNIEAEQSLISCILIDKNAIFKVVDAVAESDFYKEAHQEIYGAIKELFTKQEPIDILTLANKLENKGKLQDVGGRTYLSQLSNFVATASNVENYAEIIKHKATLRRLQAAATEISEMSFDEETEIDEILDQVQKKIFTLSENYSRSAFLAIDSLLTQAFERIDELHKQGGKLRGLPTGFNDLDNLLAGLQKSDLVILAARPSVGKTTLALDIARQSAVKTKLPVGIFSLEMSKEQLVDRMLCAQAGVSLWKMRTGNLSDRDDSNDFARIGEAMGQLSEAPIYIDDSSASSVLDIRAKARRLMMDKKGLGLIIIDYLQLMESRTKYKDNRVQEVSEISRGLKGIARELNVPVLALSQLSRAVELEKPAIPKLSHLRESGSIEQDADVVMFVYRKAADRNYSFDQLTEEEKHAAEIHIAKHRNGPVGRIDLYFDPETTSFKNLTKHDYGEAPPEF
jgi:replicative DNA helicase